MQTEKKKQKAAQEINQVNASQIESFNIFSVFPTRAVSFYELLKCIDWTQVRESLLSISREIATKLFTSSTINGNMEEVINS